MNDPLVQYTPTTGELRTYKTADGYQKRRPFDCIINVLWLSDDIAMLRGAHGLLTRSVIFAICKTLYQRGAKQLIVKRAKGKKIPFGTLTESTAVEDTYHINLITLRGIDHA